jgi:hypothetical protein
MATIVTRTGKGSALTFAEGDANFTNLNTDKLEDITSESIGDLSDVNTSTGGNVTDVDDVRNPNTRTLSGATSAGAVYNTKLRFTGSDVTSAGLALNTDYFVASVVSTDTFEISTTLNGSPISLTDFGGITDFQWTAPDISVVNGSILTWSTSESKFVIGSSSGLSNIIEDTTPQLGGNLDCNNFRIDDAELKDYKETIYDIGSNDSPSITVGNGNVQKVTISSALSLPAFSDAVAGQSVTLLVSGSGTASGIGAYRFAGGNKTLTTLSVVSIFYDGTNYFTSIATDFQA